MQELVENKYEERKIFSIYENSESHKISKIKEIKKSIKNYNDRNPMDPITLNLSDDMILKISQSQGFFTYKTIQKIKKHLDAVAKKQKKKINKEIIQNILNLGIFYIHGKDHKFSPLMIINAWKYFYFRDNFSDDVENSLIFLIDFTIENLLIGKQTEAFSVLIDFSNVLISNIDRSIRLILYNISNLYFGRLKKYFLYNSNNYMNTLCYCLTNDFTSDKIIIITKNEQLLDYFNKCQLEEKYGGNCSDKNENFFPPFTEVDINYSSQIYKGTEYNSSSIDEFEYLSITENGFTNNSKNIVDEKKSFKKTGILKNCYKKICLIF